MAELLRDETAARTIAEQDPFLTTTVLCWAMDEGDIPLYVEDGLAAALTAALGQGARQAFEADVEGSCPYIGSDLWETVCVVLGTCGIAGAVVGGLTLNIPLALTGGVLMFAARLALVALFYTLPSDIWVENKLAKEEYFQICEQGAPAEEANRSNYA